MLEDHQRLALRLVYKSNTVYGGFMPDEEFIRAELPKAQHAGSFAGISTNASVTLRQDTPIRAGIF